MWVLIIKIKHYQLSLIMEILLIFKSVVSKYNLPAVQLVLLHHFSVFWTFHLKHRDNAMYVIRYA